jgi:hypothetical protein
LAFFAQPPASDAPRSKSRQILRLVDMAGSLWRNADLRKENRALPDKRVDEPSTDVPPHVVRHIHRNCAYTLVDGKQFR